MFLWNIRYYYENLANYYSHYNTSLFTILSQQDINIRAVRCGQKKTYHYFLIFFFDFDFNHDFDTNRHALQL